MSAPVDVEALAQRFEAEAKTLADAVARERTGEGWRPRLAVIVEWEAMARQWGRAARMARGEE